MEGIVKHLKALEEPTFSENATISQELAAGVHKTVQMNLSGTVTVGSAPTVRPFGSARLLGDGLGLYQNQQARVRMDGPDWYLTHLFANAALGRRNDPTTNGAAYQTEINIPLDAFVPGTLLDTRGAKGYVQGKFGDADDYASANPPTAIDGRLRVNTEVIHDRSVDGIARPHWTQSIIRVENSSTKIPFQRRFESLELLPWVMLRTFDASADTDISSPSHVNGLVKEVSVEVQMPGETNQEIARYTWGELLNLTSQRFNLTGDDQFDGVVMLPLQMYDPDTGLYTPMKFGANSVLTLNFDTAATVEPQFTGVTPATGDAVYATFFGSELFTTQAGKAKLAQKTATAKGLKA